MSDSIAPHYAVVRLPLSVGEDYHYRIPPDIQPRPAIGCRVLVPLGTKRFYTGIVVSLCRHLPAGVKTAKDLMQVTDEVPLLSSQDLEFHSWLADYYLCHAGEVLRAALPKGLLPESRTMVTATPDFTPEGVLSRDDSALLDLLSAYRGKPVSLDALRKELGRPAIAAFSRLLKIGAIRFEEELQQKYRPRVLRMLRLAEAYCSEEALNEVAASLVRAPRQEEILFSFIEKTEGLSIDSAFPYDEISLSESKREAAITALRKRGILRLEYVPVSRINDTDASPLIPFDRTERPSALPEGVSYLYTTDIRRKEYLFEQFVAMTVEDGLSVLFLSPDAGQRHPASSLPQRMAERYGAGFLPYHGRMGAAMAMETFSRVAEAEGPLIVHGMRSAVLLPFRRLGLIIVDEEHEYAYKQQDPAPRFHARNAAVFLGLQRGARVLLASECPSSEAYYNLGANKWKLLKDTRSRDPDLSESLFAHLRIEAIDTERLRRSRQMPAGEIISPQVVAAVNETLAQGRCVLLIQNRRGYAPYMLCRACGRRLSCPRCDVTLAYHKQGGRLECRHCGYAIPRPRYCPICKDTSEQTLSPVGYGSERAEEEAVRKFPGARVLRMDSDLAAGVRRLDEALARIEEGEVDIIVGTQLIKGQPIRRSIGLIAVLSLDSILAFPDFRSEERAYQLLFSLALKTLGENLPVRFLLQTANPESPFIESFRQGDYPAFLREQMALRRQFLWPPFVRLVIVTISAFDEALCQFTAERLSAELAINLPENTISRIDTPSVGRIKMQYLRRITLRRLPNQSLAIERAAVHRSMETVREKQPQCRKARIRFDVDPL